MADEVADAVIPITVNSSQANAEFARVAATGQQAASKVTTSWAAAAKALNQNQMISQLETVSAMFIQVGGSVSQMSMLVTSAIRPLALLQATLGGASIAAVSLPVGLLAAAGAASSVAKSSMEAAKRLEELGLQVDETHQARTRNYDRAVTDLGIAFDELKVAVGSDLIEPVTTIIQAFAGGVRTFHNVYEAVQPFREEMELLSRAVVATASFGGSELLMWLARAGAAANDAEQFVEVMKEHVEALGDASSEAAAEVNDLAMETAALQDIAEGARQQRMADQAAEEAARAATARRREEQERLNEALRESQRIGAIILDEAAAAEEATAAQRTEVIRLREAWQDAEQAAAEAQADLTARLKAANDEIVENERKMVRDRSLLLLDYTGQALGSIQSILESEVASWQSREAAGEVFTRGEIDRANDAIRAAETAAIIEAGIQAGLGTLAAATSLMTVGVPPPIAIPAAVAYGALSYAATVAAIKAHSPAYFEWNGPGGTNPGDNVSRAEAAGANDDPGRDKPGDGNGNVPDLAGHQNGSARSRGPSRATQGGVTVDVIVRAGLPGRSGRGTI